ncbi:MAG: chemotaxis protein MotA, partial [Reinekea sp.]
MDIAMIVGLIGAIAMIVMSMLLGGSIGIFINIPSVLIVFGG